MADDFAERYGELLTGSYDCVDRIVLNAYYPLGHNPGGFRVWWRRWHGDSDADLDDAHLMRLPGRFARRVRAWAKANGVPVIDCTAGQRKHQIAEEYLAGHSVGPGVFLILVARARATVWKVKKSAAGVIGNLEKKTEYVNHYSDAGRVARAGHDGLRRGRTLVIPGLLNQALAFSVRLSPRILATKVSGYLQA